MFSILLFISPAAISWGKLTFSCSVPCIYPCSFQPAICYSEWHPDAFRCHQSTVRKVICCSLFHTQIELPVPVRPAAQRCVKDCSVGPGRGLCYFLFFPSIAFLLFTYDISNHHLVNTSSLLFFLFYLLSYFVLPLPFVTLFMLLSFHLTRLGFIDTSSQAERSLSFMR